MCYDYNGSERLYGFTIKETATKEVFLSEASYEKALQEIRKRGDILDLTYEDTKRNGMPARLHIHGIVEFKRIPKLSTICPPTYSMRFERIYDIAGWQKYCSKENDRLDNTKYMFDD